MNKNGAVDLLAIDDEAKRRWNIEVLRPSVRILLGVHVAQECSIKDAEFFSRLSNRGFQIRFDELLQRDLLVVEPSAVDRRRKVVSLTPKGKSMIALLIGDAKPTTLSAGDGAALQGDGALQLQSPPLDDAEDAKLTSRPVRLR